MEVAHERIATDLTVLVPTLGRPVLEQCLEALCRGTVLPSEILVVHQGNDERTRRLCEQMNRQLPLCRYLPFPDQRGVARARNRGLERCRTPFVAMIDDDCVADDDWLEVIAELLRERPDVVITGQVRGETAGPIPSLVTADQSRIYDAVQQRRDVLYTGCMGCATSLVHRVGWFEESAAVRPAAEDNEWAYRVLRAGVAIHYEPRASVTHLDWRSAAQTTGVERSYARGQGGFYGLHLRRLDPLIARRALRDLARDLRRAVSCATRRDRAGTGLHVLRALEMLRGILTGVLVGSRRVR